MSCGEGKHSTTSRSFCDDFLEVRVKRGRGIIEINLRCRFIGWKKDEDYATRREKKVGRRFSL